MKAFVTSIVIGIVIIAGSILYTHHLQTISDELVVINDAIMSYIENEQYDEANGKIQELSDYLESKRQMLATTGNHQELDTIQVNLSELKRFSQGRMKTDALSKCQVLDFLFHHLPQDYKLKFENIL